MSNEPMAHKGPTFNEMVKYISELIGEDFAPTNGKLGKDAEPIARRAYCAVMEAIEKSSLKIMTGTAYFIKTFLLACIRMLDGTITWTDEPRKEDATA